MHVASDALAIRLIRRLLQASIRGSSNQEDTAARVPQGSAAEPLFKLCGTCEGTGKQHEEYSIGSSSAGGCRVLEVKPPKLMGVSSHLTHNALRLTSMHTAAQSECCLMQHCSVAEELSRV